MNYRDIQTVLAPFSGRPLLLGFSGGADSLYLLLHLRESGIPFTAVHFEHGLRGGESRADAEYCRRLCRDLRIPFRLIELLVPARRRKDESPEAAARRCRLTAWKDLTAAAPRSVVLLAHQADDRRENLLLRLVRGANASGLTGLREETELDGLTVVRPLLSVPRREIEAYLRRQGRTGWRNDSSNQDNAHRRNFLRNRLLPELRRAIPAAEAGLDRALEVLQQEAEYLEELAERELRKIHSRPESDAAFWRRLPGVLQIRVLRGYLSRHCQAEVIPGHAFLRRFRNLLALPPSPEPRRLPIPGFGLWVLQADVFHFATDKLGCRNRWAWESEEETVCRDFVFTAEKIDRFDDAGLFEAVFDAEALPDQLILEPARPGDRLIPFGRGTPEKLKKLRTDRKIPAEKAAPLLKTPDGVIIWAPGVRRSNFAPVAANTRRIVRFRCRPVARPGRDDAGRIA